MYKSLAYQSMIYVCIGVTEHACMRTYAVDMYWEGVRCGHDICRLLSVWVSDVAYVFYLVCVCECDRSLCVTHSAHMLNFYVILTFMCVYVELGGTFTRHQFRLVADYFLLEAACTAYLLNARPRTCMLLMSIISFEVDWWEMNPIRHESQHPNTAVPIQAVNNQLLISIRSICQWMEKHSHVKTDQKFVRLLCVSVNIQYDSIIH